MNEHDLRVEIPNQKLTNQKFLFTGRIDLNGKLIEAILLLKVIEAFENYLEAIDENLKRDLQSSKKQICSLKQIEN